MNRNKQNYLIPETTLYLQLYYSFYNMSETLSTNTQRCENYFIAADIFYCSRYVPVDTVCFKLSQLSAPQAPNNNR